MVIGYLGDNSEPSSAQFLRMTPDGHLKVYENRITDNSSGWIEVGDLLTHYLSLDECNYPLVCGRYEICNNGKQCSCPPGSSSIISLNYFKPINEEQPNQGCSAVTPLTCNFLRKEVARSDIFSLMRIDGNATLYISSTLIKVQNTTNLTSRHRNNQPLKVGIALGMPSTFSSEELKNATENFTKKLGERGTKSCTLISSRKISFLDEDWNAKIFVFGVAKLIDKKQRKVITNMRGTASYLAPKWLSGVVIEKLDVYSFGVVL
ncbi:hypothetical protein LIER_41500 [Lithospermum erythrorhizon]|uniref:Protein kinase domain-containing protein n=1 Tax=Lithospermum erythrorhizon TaxID=34254 RepID=A0AAV3RBV3_LITER